MPELIGEQFVNPIETSERVQKREYLNRFPELIANAPLEKTSLVYSVPVMGEWKNGNLLRMLKGMFSQRIEENVAFEIELIENIGPGVGHLIDTDENYLTKNNEKERLLMVETAKNKKQEDAINLLKESEEAIVFLKKVVESQRLARNINAQTHNEEYRKELKNIQDSVTDPLQKDVLQMSIKKAEQISLAVIDATRTVFWRTEYEGVNMSSLRTLGADMVMARFEGKPDLVLGLYDADTIPEDNGAVLATQLIFDQHPDMKYAFAGVSDLPVGHNKDFVADAPRENTRRTWSYNKGSGHGSPQILFRLDTYRKLKEISSGSGTGFHGDEDRDTAIRLIYHFGALQDGLLLESYVSYEPTSLTADRLDGSVDSDGRVIDFENNGVRQVTTDMGYVLSFREDVFEEIERQIEEGKQLILQELSKSRDYYLRKQERQQRFNRLVLNNLLDAIDGKFIVVVDGKTAVDFEKLMTLRGGIALSHYVRANLELVGQVMSSDKEVDVIRYLLGRISDVPEAPLTPFQLGVREYIGSVIPFDNLAKDGHVSHNKVSKEVDSSGWKIDDIRDNQSGISLMHSSVAEILALGHVYRKYFQTKKFLESRDDDGGSFSRMWPKNPEDQKINMSFGDQEERLKRIKKEVNITGDEIVRPQKKENKSWWSKMVINSFPIFRLFKIFQ